jgi:hypothetical protein
VHKLADIRYQFSFFLLKIIKMIFDLLIIYALKYCLVLY